MVWILLGVRILLRIFAVVLWRLFAPGLFCPLLAVSLRLAGVLLRVGAALTVFVLLFVHAGLPVGAGLRVLVLRGTAVLAVFVLL